MAQLTHPPFAARVPWLMSAGLILVAGLALIYLGTMRLVVGLTLLPSDATLDAIQQLKPVPEAALDSLINAQASALALGGNARIWGNEGLSLGIRATMLQREGASTDKVSLLRDNAKDALVKSLSNAPANPYVWARLALLSSELEAPDEMALSYWRYAQLTGPNETRLRLARVSLGIPLWNVMSDADRAALASDLANAWPTERIGILALASNNFSRAVIRTSLLSDLPKLIQFEKEFAQTHKAPK